MKEHAMVRQWSIPGWGNLHGYIDYQHLFFVKILIASFSWRRHHAEHVHILHTRLVKSGIYTYSRIDIFLRYIYSANRPEKVSANFL